MATQRSINFVGAMHEMRASRVHTTEPLRGPDGSWNKGAIMHEAIRLARMLGRTGGLSFREKLAISLRGVWEAARKAGPPASPAQVDRRWPTSRLLASAGREVRA
jgi:hypothetical protein